ncbi:MAG: hypothetical protein H0Z40_11290 [Desulfotomaculum sp.]|nr:hypothetical protein [Desulfotomaculum sp.]
MLNVCSGGVLQIISGKIATELETRETAGRNRREIGRGDPAIGQQLNQSSKLQNAIERLRLPRNLDVNHGVG